MKRARATALALVNWKGVFYERYLLDPNVTALEGANGAGKTTVMVGAYVVLLPDLSKLRFSNVGESGGGAGDRGLRGRLGDPARPSYAALEFECADGERFVAGVHLAQRGADLVLTPFSFSGVSLDGSLKDLLLVTTAEHDEVPELAQVKERAAALGGTLIAYPSAKEYFAALFERGIFPLRLQIDEERRNWNELLRTSMSGGISRALTTELRSFLLKEETGLSDTLHRMRETLDACRRTRAEVRESTRLEGEIGGVYEAGLAMFEAAAAGRRSLQRSTLAALASARDEARRAQLARDEARRDLDASVAYEAASQAQLAESRVQDAARTAHQVAHQRYVALTREVQALTAAHGQARDAERAVHFTLESVHTSCDTARAEQAQARSAYEDAAVGMADLQDGLEDLHRLVHRARRGRELEDRAATLAAAWPARASVADVDARLSSLERRHAGQELARHRHDSAFALLARLYPQVAADDAQSVASALLAAHAQDVAKGELLSSYASEAARARLEVEAYTEARGRAETGAIEPGPGVTERTRAALAACRAAQNAAGQAVLGDARRIIELSTRIPELETQLEDRRLALPLHSAGHATLSALRAHFESPEELDALALRGLLGTRLLVLERERAAATAALAECTRWLARLEVESGVPAEVARLAEVLGGELLASRFDEVDDETATRIEAELGPLATAIVVDDFAAALAQLEKAERQAGSREELVIVRADAALAVGQKSVRKAAEVWVDEPYGLRIVRAESTGLLGKARRGARARELRAQVDTHRGTLAALTTLEQQLLAWTEALGAASAIELAVDAPAVQLEALEAEQATAQAEHADAEARVAALRWELDALGDREAKLLALAERVRILELPAPSERAAAAEWSLQDARDAEQRAASRATAVAELSLVADVFREPPLPAQSLETALNATRAERDGAWQLATVERELAELGPAPRSDDVCAAEAALERGTGARATTQALWQERQRALAAAETAAAQLDAALHEASAIWQRAALEREVSARQLSEREAAWHATAPAAAQDSLFEAHAPPVAEAERGYADAMATRVRAEEKARATHEAAIASASWEVESEESAQEKSAVFEHFEIEARASQVCSRAPDGEPTRDYKECFAEADSRGRLLVDRLQTARGGTSAAEAVAGLVQQGSFVAAWVHARAWLTERLPLALVDLPDPHSALDRLRTQLAELEATLTRQETDLQGASGDVARGIDVRVRRAKATVRRMNQHLGKVQFGSVSGIRVDLVRVAKMDAVLEAMREGKAQELLFDPSMPIEQAFEEIFRRFAGGGRGADRLLDYREYLELMVMVQRRGKLEWEIASPARLSTGEAIGVGASLLMVVLTEWEQSSQMFRKASSGSLRFLFLDEANRLSSDNLGVLFELCEKLELQLLLAAPEVAQAQGNTTYRLVRRVDDSGREEVVVSGRRLVAAG